MTRPLTPHYLTQRQHLIEWLATLSAKGQSPRTQESYRERLLPFVTWCEARGVMTAQQVSQTVLEAYQRHLHRYRKANGQPLTAGGQLARLTALRSFFRWLLKRHIILHNPAELLELPKAEKHLPSQVFSENETLQVLDSVEVDTLPGLRNRAILEMLWSTGIRRMELAGLMTGDVDVIRGVAYVRHGKGNKDRVVPVGKTALLWLARYLKDVRPRLAQRYDSGHLFLTNKGTGLKRSTLTQLAGQAIREKAQINKPGACHIFRHSMATQMLENGADTRHIQAILGHEKLETTQIYTRVTTGHLQQVHARTHPAEKGNEGEQGDEEREAAGLR